MLTIAMPTLLQKTEAEKVKDGKYSVNCKAPDKYVSIPLSVSVSCLSDIHTHTEIGEFLESEGDRKIQASYDHVSL